MNKISLKKISNNVLNIQINSIEKLKSSFDKNFEEIIDFLAKIKGRIVIESDIYLGMIHMHQILSQGIR